MYWKTVRENRGNHDVDIFRRKDRKKKTKKRREGIRRGRRQKTECEGGKTGGDE